MPFRYRRVGTEVLASTGRIDEVTSSVVALSDGTFALVYGPASPAFGSGVIGRIYSPEGVLLRNLGLDVSGFTSLPAIAALGSGTFAAVMVANTADAYYGGDRSGTAVDLVVGSAAGVTGPGVVNSTTTGNQTNPAIARLASGGYVIVWQDASGVGDTSSTGIKARFYYDDGNGSPRGTDFLVNTVTAGPQANPAVAAIPDGASGIGATFVVVWTDSSSGNADIKAQLFGDQGQKLGNEFTVNTTTPGTQDDARVVVLKNGTIVVTWTDSSGGSGDTQGSGIRARLLSAAGVPLGADFVVNTQTANNQTEPAIVALRDGGFAIAWTDASGIGGDGSATAIKAQVFTSNGLRRGPEYRVNTTTTGAQTEPSLAQLANGNLVVSWTDASLANGTGKDIRYQILSARQTSVADISGDGLSDVLFRNSNGLLVSWSLSADANGRPSFGGGGAIGGAPTQWKVQGTGDFNGDGRQDVLWRHDNGTVAMWQLDGTKLIGGGSAGWAGPEWSIAATGDFDGDGKDDVLWRSASGAVLEWQMDGATVKLSGGVGGGGPGLEWSLRGTGDFNGDGTDDILWQHADGTVVEWLLDGTGVIGGGVIAGASAGWTLQGIADFDGDSKDDLLWRYTNGATLVWQLDGTAIKADGSHGAGGTDWSIQGTGDYNGDGLADILWRHDASGAVLTWTTASDGFGTATATIIAGADPREWAMAGNKLL